MITFKLDRPHLDLLCGNLELGALAFDSGEMLDDCPKTNKKFKKMSTMIADLVNKIEKSYERNDMKVSLDERQYLLALHAVRGAFECAMCVSEEAFRELLTPADLDVYVGGIDRMKVAHAAHVVLDFLECHCPPETTDKWLNFRHESSINMLQNLADITSE